MAYDGLKNKITMTIAFAPSGNDAWSTLIKTLAVDCLRLRRCWSIPHTKGSEVGDISRRNSRPARGLDTHHLDVRRR